MAWFTVKDAVFSILIQKDECIFFQGDVLQGIVYVSLDIAYQSPIEVLMHKRKDILV